MTIPEAEQAWLEHTAWVEKHMTDAGLEYPGHTKIQHDAYIFEAVSGEYARLDRSDDDWRLRRYIMALRESRGFDDEFSGWLVDRINEIRRGSV